MLLGLFVAISIVKRRESPDIDSDEHYYEELDDYGHYERQAEIPTDDQAYEVIEIDSHNHSEEEEVVSYENARIFDVSRTDRPMDIAQIVLISLSSQRPHYADIAQLLPTASAVATKNYVYGQDTDYSQIFSDAIYERAQVYERVPNVDIARLLSNATEDLYETAQTYERVPDADIAQILLSSSTMNKSVLISDEEKTSLYEKVPNVILVSGVDNTRKITSVKEKPEIYEQVPNVDIAKILSCVSTPLSSNVPTPDENHCEGTEEQVPNMDIARLPTEDLYETAQTYERVPDAQILLSSSTRSKSVLISNEKQDSIYEKAPNIILASGADTATSGEEKPEIYEQVPTVDIAKILSSVSTPLSTNKPTSDENNCEGTEVNEQIPNVDIAKVLSSTTPTAHDGPSSDENHHKRAEVYPNYRH